MFISPLHFMGVLLQIKAWKFFPLLYIHMPAHTFLFNQHIVRQRIQRFLPYSFIRGISPITSTPSASQNQSTQTEPTLKTRGGNPLTEEKAAITPLF